MRVLFDDEIFSTQFEGGVSRYFTQLIEGLPAEGVSPLPPATNSTPFDWFAFARLRHLVTICRKHKRNARALRSILRAADSE